MFGERKRTSSATKMHLQRDAHAGGHRRHRLRYWYHLDTRTLLALLRKNVPFAALRTNTAGSSHPRLNFQELFSPRRNPMAPQTESTWCSSGSVAAEGHWKQEDCCTCNFITVPSTTNTNGLLQLTANGTWLALWGRPRPCARAAALQPYSQRLLRSHRRLTHPRLIISKLASWPVLTTQHSY